MALKLISINIEYDKHFDTVLPFLQREQPDVVCVQELFWADVPKLQAAINMGFVYFPFTRMEQETKYKIAARGIGGVALFSKVPLQQAQLLPYHGGFDHLPIFGKPNDELRGLIVAKVEKDGVIFTIATTHFTWSPDGKPNPEQRADAARLTEQLEQFPDVILTGDMNTPRGGEIFAELGSGLQDAVPSEVTTTIDPQLHYSGGLDLVVDVLFLSNAYQARSVQVVGGVSDHKAIVAEIERVG